MDSSWQLWFSSISGIKLLIWIALATHGKQFWQYEIRKDQGWTCTDLRYIYKCAILKFLQININYLNLNINHSHTITLSSEPADIILSESNLITALTATPSWIPYNTLTHSN